MTETPGGHGDASSPPTASDSASGSPDPAPESEPDPAPESEPDPAPESEPGTEADSAPTSVPDGKPGSVTVVGTAHVSERSVDEVEETIERERPDVVAVELDEGRYRQLNG
ncbi:MAG: TraB/GumN family protein, partial [Halorubrum sp.]